MNLPSWARETCAKPSTATTTTSDNNERDTAMLTKQGERRRRNNNRNKSHKSSASTRSYVSLGGAGSKLEHTHMPRKYIFLVLFVLFSFIALATASIAHPTLTLSPTSHQQPTTTNNCCVVFVSIVSIVVSLSLSSCFHLSTAWQP
jgi:hypothetical protein